MIILATAMVVLLLVWRQSKRPKEHIDKLPRKFSNYRIVRLLRSGGMADVYLADNKQNKRVALKVLRRNWLKDREAVQRFTQEANTLQEIKRAHPNAPIVHCYDIGQDARTQRYYLELEYVEGEPLDKMLSNGRALGAKDRGVIARDLCQALEATHAQGYCHLDVSAHNVMVQEGHGAVQRAILVDYGVSTREYSSGTARPDVIYGKPHYMSPEQLSGDVVTRASDLYSLGVVLYQIATGKLPFNGNPLQVVQQHQDAAVPVPAVEEPWRSTIMNLLAKQPQQRPASASLVRQLLRLPGQTFDTGSTSRKKTTTTARPGSGVNGIAVAGIAGIICLLVGGWLLNNAAVTPKTPVAAATPSTLPSPPVKVPDGGIDPYADSNEGGAVPTPKPVAEPDRDRALSPEPKLRSVSRPSVSSGKKTRKLVYKSRREKPAAGKSSGHSNTSPVSGASPASGHVVQSIKDAMKTD
jgi:serine/threonine-protein kinase